MSVAPRFALALALLLPALGHLHAQQPPDSIKYKVTPTIDSGAPAGSTFPRTSRMPSESSITCSPHRSLPTSVEIPRRR